MVLKNYMETLVENKIDELIKDNNVCTCDRCKADIMAIALNNLHPKYVVTKEGECYAKLSSYEIQNAVDVISSITLAIDIVSKTPRH